MVVSWLSEGVINHTFAGLSPASPDIEVWLLKEICSFPMIPIKLSVFKMNDNSGAQRAPKARARSTIVKKIW